MKEAATKIHGAFADRSIETKSEKTQYQEQQDLYI